MIDRYEQKDLSSIWSERSKFEAFLKVEIAITKALEQTGDIPKGVAKSIESQSIIDPERIEQLDKILKHDIIAFCTSITEKLPVNVAKYFHYGVTSSDIIDSALNLQIKQSLEIILESFQQLLSSLKSKASAYIDLPCMGRSHGMSAEPMSFGVKILGHYCEFYRRYQELKNFYDKELTIQCSGAVGNYTIISPKVEKLVSQKLGLNIEPVSTQVIPRDRIAKLIQVNSLLACAIERLCVELRHLHHSDISEVKEGFSKGQKGSSIMPHKKNPISTENLTGICRVLKSHNQIAQDNIILWHERDISHSSAERLYLPDNLGLVLYSLRRLKSTIDNLEIDESSITRKVKNQATYLSSFYLHEILKQHDDHREEIYKCIQTAAFNCSSHEFKGQQVRDIFYQNLISELNNIGVFHIKLPRPDYETIKEIYLKSSAEIFKRVDQTYPLD